MDSIIKLDINADTEKSEMLKKYEFSGNIRLGSLLNSASVLKLAIILTHTSSTANVRLVGDDSEDSGRWFDEVGLNTNATQQIEKLPLWQPISVPVFIGDKYQHRLTGELIHADDSWYAVEMTASDDNETSLRLAEGYQF
ncbi:MAG: hypothetical protein HRU20_28165 [Pseudomonadales bacterium]|nr:hypothetical protein [Pseudomonadales bacterium]